MFTPLVGLPAWNPSAYRKLPESLNRKYRLGTFATTAPTANERSSLGLLRISIRNAGAAASVYNFIRLTP